MDRRTLDLAEIEERLRSFAADRDWEQFHTPKNLAMALAGEAGELIEIFQWLTPGESGAIARSETAKQAVGEELADILMYLIRLADLLDIDLDQALRAKLITNELRYPADIVQGTAMKMPPVTRADEQ